MGAPADAKPSHEAVRPTGPEILDVFEELEATMDPHEYTELVGDFGALQVEIGEMRRLAEAVFSFFDMTRDHSSE